MAEAAEQAGVQSEALVQSPNGSTPPEDNQDVAAKSPAAEKGGLDEKEPDSAPPPATATDSQDRDAKVESNLALLGRLRDVTGSEKFQLIVDGDSFRTCEKPMFATETLGFCKGHVLFHRIETALSEVKALAGDVLELVDGITIKCSTKKRKSVELVGNGKGLVVSGNFHHGLAGIPSAKKISVALLRSQTPAQLVAHCRTLVEDGNAMEQFVHAFEEHLDEEIPLMFNWKSYQQALKPREACQSLMSGIEKWLKRVSEAFRLATHEKDTRKNRLLKLVKKILIVEVAGQDPHMKRVHFDGTTLVISTAWGRCAAESGFPSTEHIQSVLEQGLKLSKWKQFSELQPRAHEKKLLLMEQIMRSDEIHNGHTEHVQWALKHRCFLQPSAADRKAADLFMQRHVKDRDEQYLQCWNLRKINFRGQEQDRLVVLTTGGLYTFKYDYKKNTVDAKRTRLYEHEMVDFIKYGPLVSEGSSSSQAAPKKSDKKEKGEDRRQSMGISKIAVATGSRHGIKYFSEKPRGDAGKVKGKEKNYTSEELAALKEENKQLLGQMSILAKGHCDHLSINPLTRFIQSTPPCELTCARALKLSAQELADKPTLMKIGDIEQQLRPCFLLTLLRDSLKSVPALAQVFVAPIPVLQAHEVVSLCIKAVINADLGSIRIMSPSSPNVLVIIRQLIKALKGMPHEQIPKIEPHVPAQIPMEALLQHVVDAVSLSGLEGEMPSIVLPEVGQLPHFSETLGLVSQAVKGLDLQVTIPQPPVLPVDDVLHQLAFTLVEYFDGKVPDLDMNPAVQGLDGGSMNVPRRRMTIAVKKGEAEQNIFECSPPSEGAVEDHARWVCKELALAIFGAARSHNFPWHVSEPKLMDIELPSSTFASWYNKMAKGKSDGADDANDPARGRTTTFLY